VAEDLQPTDPESVGPYRLLGRLGGGGMGQVYLARSPGGRLVAVKVIRPELTSEQGFRARFAREVAAARTVSGVFTAPVVDADPEGPLPWLATAYVPGPSLAAAVAERGPLPPGVVLTLGAGLAEGLQAIHAARLVHRDLKPSNVLLADDGPRVIDFGISRATDASFLTQTGTIIGSPGFLSPEQAAGLEVGPPSDVFSLGAVLAFAATGQGPFGSGTAPALVYRVVNAAPDLSAVPEQVRSVIERCLVRNPFSRPTAGDLLASFGAAQRTPEWFSSSQFASPPGGPPLGPATPITPAMPLGPTAPSTRIGPATPIGANGGVDYYAPTQTHLSPTPAWPAVGVTPTAPANGGTPPAWFSGPQASPQGPPGQAGPPTPPASVGMRGPAGQYGPAGPYGPSDPYGPAAPTWQSWQQGPNEPYAGMPGQTAPPRNGGRVALIVGAAVVLVAAVAGVALAVTSHKGTPSAASSAVLPVSVSPAPPSASPAPVSTSPAAAQTSAAPSSTAPAQPAVIGVWTGTYTCNQGLTGMRMTVTDAGGDTVRATLDFYAVASNPDVPDGSYVLTGTYSQSKGLVLVPDHWISQPDGYVMVGLSGPPPSGSSMHGTVQDPSCSTFSVTR